MNSSIIIGSQEWIDYWCDFHWKVACKYTDYVAKYPKDNQFFIEHAMYSMFESYYWADRKPWVSGEGS